MPLIYRSRYGLTDLLNYFTSDFFIFYFRWLDGFYFSSHCVTSYVNITQNKIKEKRKMQQYNIHTVKTHLSAVVNSLKWSLFPLWPPRAPRPCVRFSSIALLPQS